MKNDIKPLPSVLQELLKGFGIDPNELQIAVKTAYEEHKKKENENGV